MTSVSDVLAGRYRLTGLLGQGATSDVFQAVDERSGLAVAVKVVRSGDPELARRLAQEARALERFTHPGLVQLLDTGVAGAQAYLVMELIDGSTLARLLRRGRLSPTNTARLGANLAGALAYVHARDIVHRDVKPANVLVTTNGEARLGDFGIARLMDASTLTVVGTTLGTAAYMAPEQLEDHQVGPSADIWSLGIVLLECLTGRRAYEGTSSEVVAKRLSGPVAIPADLPKPWTLVLSGMLDHRPDQRLDGGEVAALLASSAFATDWEPTATSLKPAPAASIPSDLTALAPPAGAPTRALVPDDTRIVPPGVLPEPHRKAGRRWRVVLAAILITGLVVGLLLAFGSSPAGRRAVSGGKKPAQPPVTTPTTSTTTSTTTTTTTTPPSGASALATLTNDITAGVDAGTVDSGTGDAITTAADTAVADAAAGQTRQATNELQRAATGISDGVQNGSISQAEGDTLQADLSTLTGVLGLTATTASTTAPTTIPGPGPGHGHGHGN